MSSHDSKEPVERIGSSTTKRISTLNEHEDHILRRRINAYQKIHNKEIAGVSSKLDEIRESMKALATDPLYGTHALNDVETSEGVRPSRSPVPPNGQKTKLRRTQSFPEVPDGGSNASSAKTSPFPALKGGEHHVTRYAGKSGERTALDDVPKSRGWSIGSPQIHDNAVQIVRETSDWQELGHKKLERCKTAPVAMLQPLLKTTPEMMRKKIHISTSNRHNNDDITTRGGLPSPRVGDASSRMRTQQTQADSGSILLRPKTTPDAQPVINFKLASPPRDSKKPASRFPAKRVPPAKTEPNDDAFAFSRGKNVHGHKSSNKGIDANELSDKEHSIEDLKHCRYLRFSKESQESNRI